MMEIIVKHVIICAAPPPEKVAKGNSGPVGALAHECVLVLQPQFLHSCTSNPLTRRS